MKALDHMLKDDQDIIRYIIVLADKDNNIFIKDSTLDSELDNKEEPEYQTNIDTTMMEDDLAGEIIDDEMLVTEEAATTEK
ncbi:MAG: hypothetical protein ORN26_01500 [Candidatus Pacebacteria bacterium]|nr:hypothetical protein [Candidatus Paceibacterota bacterium]